MSLYKKYSEDVIQEVLTEFGEFIRSDGPNAESLRKALAVLDYFVHDSDLTEDQLEYHDGLIFESEMRLDLMDKVKAVESTQLKIQEVAENGCLTQLESESKEVALGLLSKLEFEFKILHNNFIRKSEGTSIEDISEHINKHNSLEIIDSW
jgi:hypothetical protein